jgi:ABC-type transport system involved in multi-copper enzyme maturation permease subunit
VNAILAVAILVIKELYRRKDFYVLFVLTALITLLMGALNFFNDDQVVRYLKEICLLLIWISGLVIAVTTTARQIPAEREHRTIFPLLAKPLTRAQLIAGKFLGCWLATGLALVVFYLFFGLISASREHVWPILSYGQALWLHWFMLGVVIAMTLCGSVVFAAPSSNATIMLVVVIGILLIGRYLNKVALQLDQPLQTIVYALYFVIPHLEFYDVRDLVIHNWDPISWWACAGASLYAAVYAAFFLVVGWLVFRRQSLG